MVEQLTRRQRAIYEFLLDRVRGRGIPPTLAEIATAFGLASPSGVADHLKALERKGWIRRRPGISRGIEILRAEGADDRTGVRVPLLGRVPSRNGLRAAGRARRHVLLDGRVVQGGAAAVRVELGGLEERGILPGDLLVFRRERPPRRGDLVVARVGRGVTLVETLEDGAFRRLDTQEELRGGCRPVGAVVVVLRALRDGETIASARRERRGTGDAGPENETSREG